MEPTINETIPENIYLGATYIINTTSNSNGTFTYKSSNPNVAIVQYDSITQKNIIISISLGSTTITTEQSDSTDGEYISKSITTDIEVIPNNEVIPKIPIIDNFTFSPLTIGDTYNIVPPTSNSTGNFLYTSSNTDIITIGENNIITAKQKGTSILTAKQLVSNDNNYTSNLIMTSVNVSQQKSSPTIGPLLIFNMDYGDADKIIRQPISNSLGTFSYSISYSSKPDIATIVYDSNTDKYYIKAIAVGDITITATQSEYNNFTEGSVSKTITINPIAPTIGPLIINDMNYGDTNQIITNPTSTSKGTFSYSSSDPTIATIGYTNIENIYQYYIIALPVNTTNNVTITATQQADGNYTSGITTTQITISPSINPVTNLVTPTIGPLNINDMNYNDIQTITQPNSNSTGTFSYSTSDPTIATINYDTTTNKYYIKTVAVGKVTIIASQNPIGNYTSGTVQTEITINPIAPTITNFTIPNLGLEQIYTITNPTSTSKGTFSYASSATTKATISGNTITASALGPVTITATQEAYGNYTSGSVNTTININTLFTLSSNATSKKINGYGYLLTFTNTTNTASVTFNIDIPTVNMLAVGGGGGGYYGKSATNSANNFVGSGGGGGGSYLLTTNIKSNDICTVTVGTGGKGQTTSVNVSNGGNTIITNNGIDILVCSGGGEGNKTADSIAGNVLIPSGKNGSGGAGGYKKDGGSSILTFSIPITLNLSNKYGGGGAGGSSGANGIGGKAGNFGIGGNYNDSNYKAVKIGQPADNFGSGGGGGANNGTVTLGSYYFNGGNGYQGVAYMFFAWPQ